MTVSLKNLRKLLKDNFNFTAPKNWNVQQCQKKIDDLNKLKPNQVVDAVEPNIDTDSGDDTGSDDDTGSGDDTGSDEDVDSGDDTGSGDDTDSGDDTGSDDDVDSGDDTGSDDDVDSGDENADVVELTATCGFENKHYGISVKANQNFTCPTEIAEFFVSIERVAKRRK